MNLAASSNPVDRSRHWKTLPNLPLKEVIFDLWFLEKGEIYVKKVPWFRFQSRPDRLLVIKHTRTLTITNDRGVTRPSPISSPFEFNGIICFLFESDVKRSIKDLQNHEVQSNLLTLREVLHRFRRNHRTWHWFVSWRPLSDWMGEGHYLEKEVVSIGQWVDSFRSLLCSHSPRVNSIQCYRRSSNYSITWEGVIETRGRKEERNLRATAEYLLARGRGRGMELLCHFDPTMKSVRYWSVPSVDHKDPLKKKKKKKGKRLYEIVIQGKKQKGCWDMEK